MVRNRVAVLITSGRRLGVGIGLMTVPAEDNLLGGRRRSIDPNVSIILDLTRFLLATTVAIGHWTQSAFQDVWKDRTWVGMCAVGGFFVLSGFTIRMLNPHSSRPFNIVQYGVDRASRLWSVALPALLMTGLLDLGAYHINPQYYLYHWGEYATYPLGRLFLNAVFLAQIWNIDVSPLTNSPFWSLSYEAWFYAIFGLFMARRFVWTVVACAIAGPNIVYLMLFWLLGVAVFEIYSRALSRFHLKIVLMVSATAAIVSCAFLLLYHHNLMGKYDAFCPAFLDFGGDRFFVTGAIVSAPILLSAASGAKLIAGAFQSPEPAVRMARRLGDLTFPLYLLHFPLFVFCGAIGFYNRHSAFQLVIVFVALLGLVTLTASPTTGFKVWIRKMLRQLPSAFRRMSII
jgi:peptidoglycan/LPS O-acetylase OafA/YrhL